MKTQQRDYLCLSSIYNKRQPANVSKRRSALSILLVRSPSIFLEGYSGAACSSEWAKLIASLCASFIMCFVTARDWISLSRNFTHSTQRFTRDKPLHYQNQSFSTLILPIGNNSVLEEISGKSSSPIGSKPWLTHLIVLSSMETGLVGLCKTLIKQVSLSLSL